MKNVTRQKLFQQEIRLLIAQLFKRSPHLLRLVQLTYPHSACFKTGFEHPWRGHSIHEICQVCIIENGRELRHQDPYLACLHTHGQLIPEEAGD